eukprot:6538092-Prymnesium_polylepis.1
MSDFVRTTHATSLRLYTVDVPLHGAAEHVGPGSTFRPARGTPKQWKSRHKWPIFSASARPRSVGGP